MVCEDCGLASARFGAEADTRPRWCTRCTHGGAAPRDKAAWTRPEAVDLLERDHRVRNNCEVCRVKTPKYGVPGDTGFRAGAKKTKMRWCAL